MSPVRTLSVQAPCLTLPLLALLFPCWQVPVQAAEVSIEAHVEPNRFALNEGAILTVTIQGQRSAEPELPEVDGLAIIPMGHSTQIQWINGSMSSAVTLTYRVQAARTGSFTIAPIRIRVDGKAQTAGPVRVEVVSASGSSAGPGSGGTPVRPPPASPAAGRGPGTGQLSVKPDKNAMYSGELLPITIRGYFRQDRRVTVKGQPTPAGNGFILESLDEEPLQEEIIRDGMPCVQLTWHGTVAAIRSGKTDLRMTLPITVLVPEQRRMPRGMFNDPFFDMDSFFTHYRKKEITLQSKPVSIQVMPLPDQGRPDNFSGAVGSFSLQVEARPTELSPGDPINLTMTITGQGNFDRVRAPVFTGTDPDWKIYPPSRGEVIPESAGQDGKVQTKIKTKKSKKFEQAIIPRHAGLRKIPPLIFSYFDPKKKKYQTVTSAPIPLHVAPVQQSEKDRIEAGSAMAEQEQETHTANNPGAGTKQQGQNSLSLAPIHTEFGQGVHAVRPLWQKKWFQLVVTVLTLLFLLAVALLWRHRLRNQDTEKIAEKNHQQELAAQIKQLGEAAAGGDARPFFAQLRQIIQNHCGRRWQCETRAITAADLASRIGTDARLTRLLRTAEHAVYAPPELTPAELETIVTELEKELDQP
jgi:hypothetical protein